MARAVQQFNLTCFCLPDNKLTACIDTDEPHLHINLMAGLLHIQKYDIDCHCNCEGSRYRQVAGSNPARSFRSALHEALPEC